MAHWFNAQRRQQQCILHFGQPRSQRHIEDPNQTKPKVDWTVTFCLCSIFNFLFPPDPLPYTTSKRKYWLIRWRDYISHVLCVKALRCSPSRPSLVSFVHALAWEGRLSAFDGSGLWIFHVEWADLFKSVQFTPSWARALEGAREEKGETLKCKRRPGEVFGLKSFFSRLCVVPCVRCGVLFVSYHAWACGLSLMWNFPCVFILSLLVSPLLHSLYLGPSVLTRQYFDSFQTLGGREWRAQIELWHLGLWVLESNVDDQKICF